MKILNKISEVVLPLFILVLSSLLYSLAVLDSGRSLTILRKISVVVLPPFILILTNLIYYLIEADLVRSEITFNNKLSEEMLSPAVPNVGRSKITPDNKL